MTIARTRLVRRGDKRVAVGWWSSDDGRTGYGDHWGPTACYGSEAGKACARRWDGMVEASIMQWDNGRWRVCVWGADDTGMERDVDDEAVARRLFDRINHLVTMADLASWGFVNA
jgi:hypothetical protein